MFLLSKDKQAKALKKAVANADRRTGEEMDEFSVKLQRAILEKINRQLDKARFPEMHLGSAPYVKVEGDDGYCATLKFQCVNTDKEKDMTCAGRGNHSITGSGQDANGTFDVLQGNWSPAGYCFWVENRTSDDRKEVSFVEIHWAETSLATFTTIEKDGTTNVTNRTVTLVKDHSAALCPSVRTVLQS